MAERSMAERESETERERERARERARERERSMAAVRSCHHTARANVRTIRCH